MSHHDAPHYLHLRNNIRRAQWAMRYALQNGHSLQDLRNEEDLKRFRPVQYRLLVARRMLGRVRRLRRQVERVRFDSRLSTLLKQQAE